MSRSTIFAITPLDGKSQNLQTSLLHFLFSLRYDLWERKYHADRHTEINTHKNGQAHGYKLYLADLPKKLDLFRKATAVNHKTKR